MPENVINDHLGPVEYLAIEFPRGAVTAEGFSHVLALVEAGTIWVLDLEFARRVDGVWQKVAAGSLGVTGVDLTEFEGADSELLDADDLAILAADVADDSVLAVLVYENLAMNGALQAWGAQGAKLVAEGPVSHAELDAALTDNQSN